MLKPVKKTRLYEEIIKQLQDLIRKGELKPGDKLPPERELALELNVSRTAIREALRSLEMMGFIDSKVGDGTFIKQVTLDNVIEPYSLLLSRDKKLMLELIEVRLLLETETARLAALKRDVNDLIEIEKALDLMKREINDGQIGLYGDKLLHDMIAKASYNSAMSKLLALCGDLLSFTIKATLDIPGQPQKSLEDHTKIVEAIKKGDGEAAAKHMREHLLKAYRNLEKLDS